MLAKIKNWLCISDQSSGIPKHEFNLALGALLVEVMQADQNLHPEEQALAIRLLQNRLSLTSQEAEELVQDAKGKVDEAIDLYAFSKAINNQTSSEERIDILTLLWQMALADGEIDRHEEHLIRRIAGLLYVTHEDFIVAKLRANKG
ncbi:TerB family tellurite resistance protein [Pseudoalteromonas xiamenensis]|uniref:tellurite resistance TerB family protein n=1 Tax=Pseudoalteromonas xiamenensis TaxID=882626 RepID=UPI0027E4B82F|nr:TerB family tellurite resistance protein [Pseudoalteromonas xiamenensis]WMN58695.1 TerB family tellurite resistance protein [Pseudoalteromonas xiamenensis]